MTTISDIEPGVRRANGVAGPAQGQWTYENYLGLPEDGNRYEIINGVLYMAPSPSFFHQEINLTIGSILHRHIKEAGLGRVVTAPSDVRLVAGGAVVQPDVLVVLNAHLDRITENGITGAPDLVVEITSPGTASYDRYEKRMAYENAGVTEYWIVDPSSRTIEVFLLKEGVYESQGVFREKAKLPSVVAQDLAVPVEQFFA